MTLRWDGYGLVFGWLVAQVEREETLAEIEEVIDQLVTEGRVVEVAPDPVTGARRFRGAAWVQYDGRGAQLRCYEHDKLFSGRLACTVCRRIAAAAEALRAELERRGIPHAVTAAVPLPDLLLASTHLTGPGWTPGQLGHLVDALYGPYGAAVPAVRARIVIKSLVGVDPGPIPERVVLKRRGYHPGSETADQAVDEFRLKVVDAATTRQWETTRAIQHRVRMLPAMSPPEVARQLHRLHEAGRVEHRPVNRSRHLWRRPTLEGSCT